MEVVPIVKTITRYLDLNDLLQVRLLNTLWNECAKLHIKKHYVSLKDDRKLVKLSEFLSNANSSSFSFLKLDISMKDMTLNVLKDLMQKFGKSFLGYRFGFSTYYSIDKRKTIQYILSNSPNIVTLELITGDEGVGIATTEHNFFLPKLTTVKLPTYSERDINFIKQILDASPSLKCLKITRIHVELSYVISTIGNRNIRVVLKNISEESLKENSSFNSRKFPIELTSVHAHTYSCSLIYISKLKELLQQYSHTIKKLYIEQNEVNPFEIPTMKYLETLMLNNFGALANFHDHFYKEQFPSLKRLEMDGLPVLFIDPKLPYQNLKQLKLHNCWNSSKVGETSSNKPPLDLPLLEILIVFARNTMNRIKFGKTENVRKLIMYNGFEYKDIPFQFPNLKSLTIMFIMNDLEIENLNILFQILPWLEELTLDDQRFDCNDNVMKSLTGLGCTKIELVNILKQNNLSLAQDLLKDSKPNLGNLTALRSLTILSRLKDNVDNMIGIAFMIFSGKLNHLRKFEIGLKPFGKGILDLFIGDIFSSNNTQCFILKPNVNFYDISRNPCSDLSRFYYRIRN